jgi:hypothetical protein
VSNGEVPKPFASLIGHVCGVIAVGMATLSFIAIGGLFNRVSLVGVVVCVICIGLTVVMFRWAGSLTGYWDVRGGLSLPKPVYAVLGAVFAAFALSVVGFGVWRPPESFDDGFVLVCGFFGAVALTYLCYLATRRNS